MICPECNGLAISQLPNGGVIGCPTCEGMGELHGFPATNWCPACGEPIPDDRRWCDEHRLADYVREEFFIDEM